LAKEIGYEGVGDKKIAGFSW